MCKYKIDKITYSKTGSIIPELQNRITHYHVTNPVTKSRFFVLFFELVIRCERNFNIVLELVTESFKQNKISELLTRKIKKN